MFAGMKRQGDTVARGQIAAPHAAAVHHMSGGDRARLFALLPGHAGDTAISLCDLVHNHALDNLCTQHSRTLGQGQRDIAGIGLPVARQVHARNNIFHVQMRIERQDVRRGKFVHLDPKDTRHRSLTAQLLLPFSGQRHCD